MMDPPVTTARRHIDLRRIGAAHQAARKKGTPRAAITYRGARRNGARTLGRMFARPTMMLPRDQACPHWWIGIQPNGRLLVTAKTPKGKGFGVSNLSPLFNFFFPGARISRWFGKKKQQEQST